jgi:hypothetical protein
MLEFVRSKPEQAMKSLLSRGFFAAIGRTEPTGSRSPRSPGPVPIRADFWRDVNVNIDWLVGRVSSPLSGTEYADVRIAQNPLANLDLGTIHARHAYLFLDEALACVGSPTELRRALSEGYLTADGYRTSYNAVKAGRTTRFEIPPEAFLHGDIDWMERQVTEQTTRSSPRPIECVWEDVRVPRSELETIFPYVATPFQQQASKRATSPGAPTKIDWNQVWTEAFLLVGVLGKPKSKKEFVRLLLDRCQQAGLDPMPDERSIRRTIGPAYDRLS